MKLKKMVSVLGLTMSLMLSSSLLTDCTSKITEEQMAQLQDLRRRESQLNQNISTKNAEISKVEQELNARKSELTNCQKDREFVKQKLAQWPNVWPD